LIKLSSHSNKFRISFLLLLLTVLFGVLLIRVFSLQIIQSRIYRELAEKNRIKIVFIPQNRGEIKDKNGIVVAGNVPDYILEIYPYLLREREETIKKICEISFLRVSEVKKKIESAKSYYRPIILKKHLSIAEVSNIVENISELPGVHVKRRPIRIYPYGMSSSHLIGYTGEVTEVEIEENEDLKEGDMIGKSGLEREYDRYVRGKVGVEYIEVDAQGREKGIFKQMRSVEPIPGDELHLTIDIRLQLLADSLFSEYTAGSVVALNPQNGDVLALYSKPGFDPNILVKGVSFENLQKLVFTEGSSFWNRATMSIYPPGSVFKIIIALLALEDKVITRNTMMRTCTGSYRIGNRLFHCWKKHGRLHTHKAIVQSCDIFFYQVGMKLGFDAMERGIRKIFLFEKTGIDIPEENSGFFPTRSWYREKFSMEGPTRGMVANIAIGQGEVLVTPLEVCTFFGGLANNGIIVSPHIVKSIRDVSGNILYRPDTRTRRINVSEETLSFLRNAMYGVVNERKGTGVLSRIEGISVAGKTGTAENPHGEDHAWFVAFAPFDNPEICVVVMVENGGHGGSVAAPIAKRIIERALSK
jgi:penicillin-binding protein 2